MIEYSPDALALSVAGNETNEGRRLRLEGLEIVVSPGPNGAALSADGFYRFGLWREAASALADLEPAGGVLFLLANPSTADARFDDPTVRRCRNFAGRWGYRTLYIANVNPFRSTDPKHVIAPPDDVLAANDAWIWGLAMRCGRIVAAYGKTANRYLVDRALSVAGAVADIHALEFSKDGTPKHPLYLRGDLLPQRFIVNTK